MSLKIPKRPHPLALRTLAKTTAETATWLHQAGAPADITAPLYRSAAAMEKWAASIEKQQENSNILPFRKTRKAER